MRLIALAVVILTQLPISHAAETDCVGDSDCPSEAPSNEFLLEQLLKQFREAMTNQQFAEADVIAKRIVNLTIFRTGVESKATANARINLAHAQQQLHQLLPAKQNYEIAIHALEGIQDRLSPDLVDPLLDLGNIELALNDAAQARHIFERAAHITQVVDGPRSIKQVDALNGLTESHYVLGNIRGALKTQLSIYSIRARAIDPESEDFVPVLQHQADWMRKLGLPNRERNAYRQMLNIQESHNGKSDLNTLPTLIKLGHSFEEVGTSMLDADYLPLSGAPYFYWRRARRIADENPESHWKLAAQTSLISGDFYLKAHRFGLCPKVNCESFLSRRRVMKFIRARYAYEDAWEDLSATPEAIELRTELLETPKRLTDPDLPRFYDGEVPLPGQENADGFLRGTMTAEFDVSKLSKIRNIEVIDSQPGGLGDIEKLLVGEIKHLVYRPRMEDGSLVTTRQVKFEYEFYYRCNGNAGDLNCEQGTR